MVRSFVFRLALSLATTLPLLAAGEAHAAKPGKTAKAPSKERGIDAERLKRDVGARIAKQRDKLERTIKAKKLGAAKAGVLRGEFDAAAAEVWGKLHAALADGVVTRKEGRAVLQAASKITPRPKKKA